MHVVFCGTPQFAVPTFQHLLAQPDFEIQAVFTQPDRPKGRGQELSFSPVKEAALAQNIRVHQPEKIRNPESQEILQKLMPDAIVIIAYGQIIPARLLPIPKLGWINLHASLLPKYRGAAPINWAIVKGEIETGVTTMRIDAGMDTGDMLLRETLPIGPTETTPELLTRLSAIGGDLMTRTLRGLAGGTIIPQSQNQAEATLAPILKKEDGKIDWNRSATEIFNRMRGFTPWPGAYTTFRGQTCHLWGEPVSNQMASKSSTAEAGILQLVTGDWLITCGHTTVLRLTAVKLEGRKKISVQEFANGARLQPGKLFEQS